MQLELKSLESNKTWDLVPNNSNIKLLKSKWVYKIKDKDDYIELKARFVAKGFEQLYGLDFIDTYTSVIKQIA